MTKVVGFFVRACQCFGIRRGSSVQLVQQYRLAIWWTDWKTPLTRPGRRTRLDGSGTHSSSGDEMQGWRWARDGAEVDKDDRWVSLKTAAASNR